MRATAGAACVRVCGRPSGGICAIRAGEPVGAVRLGSLGGRARRAPLASSLMLLTRADEPKPSERDAAAARILAGGARVPRLCVCFAPGPLFPAPACARLPGERNNFRARLANWPIVASARPTAPCHRNTMFCAWAPPRSAARRLRSLFRTLAREPRPARDGQAAKLSEHHRFWPPSGA